MDFRHQIVTYLFSKLRLSFETQKIKENYAILKRKREHYNNLKSRCNRGVYKYYGYIC